MMLFLLRPVTGEDEVGPWNPWYDKLFGAVVRAGSQDEARRIVSERHGDEGGEVWLDPLQTTCVNVEDLEHGEPQILISDFKSA